MELVVVNGVNKGVYKSLEGAKIRSRLGNLIKGGRLPTLAL